MNWLIVILIVAAIAGLIGYFYSDKNKGVLIDEYGVKYTADKTKLISAPNNLKEYKIPNSVTSIGENAFYECGSLKNIEIPNSVTSIGENAFGRCSSLKSIEIPNSVTSIGANPFLGCDKLNDIKINNSNFTFNNGLLISKVGVLISCLSNNEKIIIPNTITSIGDNAFCGCSSLKSIEIPNSVTSIGDFAFCVCESLKSIEIPNSVTSIGDEAFLGCSSLKSIIVCSDNPYLVKKDGEWLLNLPNGAGIEDIEINIKE